MDETNIKQTDISSEHKTLNSDSVKDTNNKTKNPIPEIISFVAMIVLIVVPIRFFVAQPFIVSGASMDDTFFHNEYLIVDHLTYKFKSPERGDIAIFRYPQDPSKFFIKRIIGIPGDKIQIDSNRVTIFNKEFPEGVLLDEPYVKSMNTETFLEEKLQSREFFVMGDNRDESSDSRIWGVLQEENIIGRAFLRLFPFRRIDFLPGYHELLN